MKHIDKIKIDNNFLNQQNSVDFIVFRNELFYSIFEGEFYDNDLENKVDVLIQKLNHCKDNTSTTDYSLLRYNLAHDNLLHYKYLNQFAINRLEEKFKNKFYNFELENEFFHPSIYERETQNINNSFKWLFVANIKLAEIDEGYEVSEKNIQILSEIFHKLNRINNALKLFVDKTRVKCSILLYKIFIRLKKTDKDTDFFVFNDEYLTFEYIKSFVPQEIIKAIDSQYNCQANNEIYSVNKLIKTDIENKNITVSNAHKFIKDVKLKKSYTEHEFKKTLENLNNLNEYFLDKINTNDNNNISFKTIVYLIINSKFYLECQYSINALKQKFNFNNLEVCNENIENLFKTYSTNHENYPNFINDRIYIKSKIEIIEILEKKNVKEINEDGNDYFTLLQEIFKNSFSQLNKLKNKIRICQKNRIMPLYLEIENCKLRDNSFIDSHYILPSNYEYLASECEEFWDELKLKENIFYSLTPKPINELAENLKKEIKDQQYNTITVIGLYASFLAFILSNVNILPKLIEYSIGAVLAFMLVFGIVIFYFITSLKMIFTAKRLFKGISNFIVWTLIGLSITTTGIYAIFHYIQLDFKKEIQNRKTTTTITTFDIKTGKKQSETKTLEQNSESQKKDSLK